MLAQATLLAHPRKGADLVLITDASDTAMGAVLQQIKDSTRTTRILLTSILLGSKKLERVRPRTHNSLSGNKIFQTFDRRKKYHTANGPQTTFTFAFQQKSDKTLLRQWRRI